MLTSWRGCAARTRLRIAALAVGGSACLAVVVVGCSNVVTGTATVNTADAPVYQASVSASVAESAASSSAEESERQASVTAEAVSTACEAMSISSADAITAVNGYVDAYNTGADATAAVQPAVDALNATADQVAGARSDPLGPELNDALTRWGDAARAAAGAIGGGGGPVAVNDAINQLNDSRTVALELCDASY